MIRKDLKAVGIPYLDKQGRQFDFHSLRVQFVTMLAAAGVHPGTAQRLARHSDIRLTMQNYTSVDGSDLAGAVQKLPSVETALATGASADGCDSVMPIKTIDSIERESGREQIAAELSGNSGDCRASRGIPTVGAAKRHSVFT